MELLFANDELQLLIEMLEQRDRELTGEIARTDIRAFRHELARKQRTLNTLQNKIIRKETDLTGGELDLLKEIVEHFDIELLGEISHASHREFKHMLQSREDVLTRIQKKVVESCAIV